MPLMATAASCLTIVVFPVINKGADDTLKVTFYLHDVVMGDNSAINPDKPTYNTLWQNQGSTILASRRELDLARGIGMDALQVKENFGFSERLSNDVGFVRNYPERLGSTSKGMRESGKNSALGFSISETGSRLNSFIRDYEEPLNFKERPQRLTTKVSCGHVFFKGLVQA